MPGKALMIQGTGSHVGKSVMTAGFCRLLRQDGFRVSPFKAQNMSNNSFALPEGGEIGRAQAVQAEAAGVEPCADINPILIKPSSDSEAQVVVLGRPFKTMRAHEYQFQTSSLFGIVKNSLERLMNEFDMVVIEGAGSPAEINLKDIVNMPVAELADAPVILVGDIDRGGVFASLIGTLELLTPEHRARVKGFIINKFRGDESLLKPGLQFLEEKTGIPILGVIPYMPDLGIMEEDGLSDERMARNEAVQAARPIMVDVIWLPHISNYTDFLPLDREQDVTLTYLREVPSRFPDVLILPGTKSTVSDLRFLKQNRFASWIRECARRGVQIIGICGGFQILGERILDPAGAESGVRECEGLSLLPVETVFQEHKIAEQVHAVHLESGTAIKSYEIHMGETRALEFLKPVFHLTERGNKPADLYDGAVSEDGQIWGTYLHGLFDSNEFRTLFLNELRQKKGFSQVSPPQEERKEIYDELAALLRSHVNMDLFYQILNRENEVLK